MRHAERPPTEVLVLRAWIEGHRTPLRVRILGVTVDGEQTSMVVHREQDVLAVVAEWLQGWSTYGENAETGVE